MGVVRTETLVEQRVELPKNYPESRVDGRNRPHKPLKTTTFVPSRKTGFRRDGKEETPSCSGTTSREVLQRRVSEGPPSIHVRGDERLNQDGGRGGVGDDSPPWRRGPSLLVIEKEDRHMRREQEVTVSKYERNGLPSLKEMDRTPERWT